MSRSIVINFTEHDIDKMHEAVHSIPASDRNAIVFNWVVSAVDVAISVGEDA